MMPAFTRFARLSMALTFCVVGFPVRSAPARAAVVADTAQADPRSWLPEPEEELESAEPLVEEALNDRAGLLLRGALVEGRLRLRRIAWLGKHGRSAWEGALLEEEGRARPGLRFRMDGRRPLALAFGRVTATQAPVLFAESMRLVASGRRVRPPRVGVLDAAPSHGSSEGSLDGGAVSLSGPGWGWAFAGRRSRGRERVAGVGLGFVLGSTRCAGAFGILRPSEHAGSGGGPTRSRTCGSIAALHRGGGAETSIEALVSREGRSLLAQAAWRDGPALLTGRWRYRSWAGRVAAELGAQTRGQLARVRLIWRSWSDGAFADDGALELEGMSGESGILPVRVRVGAVGMGRSGGLVQPRERYALLDATLARDAGRTFSLHVLRRAVSTPLRRSASTTAGAKLEVEAGRFGRHVFLVESTRVRSGAAAWGIGLSPSGVTTLRARTRPGIWIAARGGFGARLGRVGYVFERAETAGGPGPWSGSVSLRLAGDWSERRLALSEEAR